MDIDKYARNIDGLAPKPTDAPASGRPQGARAQPESAFLILDLRGHILFCSPDAAHLLGAQDKPMIGQSVSAFISSLPLQKADSAYNLDYIGFWSRNDHWQKFQTHGASVEIRFNRLELEGQTYVTLELRSPELNPIEQSLQKLIQTLEMSSEVVVITDTEGEIEYVNRAFEQHTGYRRVEALGCTHALLGADRSSELYAQMWATLRTGKPFHGVFINCHKNGQLFHEERNVRPFIDHHGRATHYIFSGRDVSDREQVITRLEHLANHDGLTGLPNRNLFMDRLRQATVHAVRRHSGFTLLLLDLDHFKAVNDRLGHAAGDALLIAVGARLRVCVREEDTVARLGGDEFAIILSDAALADDALIVLEKISNALRQPIVIEGRNIPTNVSIGVAFYPEDSVAMETLLKFADIAMYRVKNAGGNGYQFHRQRDSNRFTLASLMRRKLTN